MNIEETEGEETLYFTLDSILDTKEVGIVFINGIKFVRDTQETEKES